MIGNVEGTLHVGARQMEVDGLLDDLPCDIEEPQSRLGVADSFALFFHLDEPAGHVIERGGTIANGSLTTRALQVGFSEVDARMVLSKERDASIERGDASSDVVGVGERGIGEIYLGAQPFPQSGVG